MENLQSKARWHSAGWTVLYLRSVAGLTSLTFWMFWMAGEEADEGSVETEAGWTVLLHTSSERR